MRSSLLTLLLFFTTLSLASQTRGDHWFLDSEIHLTFDDTRLRIDRDSRIVVGEAKSSISSPDGECLFYATATELWDCEGNLITDQLRGDNSSSQGALIIPMPDEPDLYYVITADACLNTVNNFTVDGISWSVVRAPVGGAVSIVTLNRTLIPDIVAERVDATLHANGRDYWLTVREPGTATFLTWLISPAGISTAIRQTIGTPDVNPFLPTGEDQCATGKHRFSPDGRFLAYSSSHDILELFDFDNVTGRFSNPRLLVEPVERGGANTYDVAFSPGSCFLYGGAQGDRYGTWQYDLRGNPDRESLLASRVLLSVPGASSNVESEAARTMQIGPDGRLYFNTWIELPSGERSTPIGAILYPDVKGLACGYRPDYIRLDPDDSFNWLLNLVDAWFADPYACNRHPLTPFTVDTVLCPGETLTLTLPWSRRPDLRVTRRVEGGTQLEVSDSSATYRFDAPGQFRVVIAWEDGSGLRDSTVGSVRVVAPFRVEAGEDRTICEGESTTLGDPANRSLGEDVVIEWTTDNGVPLQGPEPRVSPATSTIYRVIARDTIAGCTSIDSVRVDVAPAVRVDLGESQRLCPEDTLRIAAVVVGENLRFEWSGPSIVRTTGDSLVAVIPASGEGVYTLRAIDTLGGCTAEATLRVEWSATRIELSMRRDYHIWSGLNQVVEIESTPISGDEGIDLIEGDITFDPRVMILNPEPLASMLGGTMLEGWNVERSEITAPGLMQIRLRAPAGSVLEGEGTLLQLVANLFLGPVQGSDIAFTLRMNGRCLDIIDAPGYVRLDTICSFNNRLLEISAGRYRPPVAQPNPTSGDAQITFAVGLDARTTLRAYDPSGRLVATILDQTLSVGTHTVRWEAPPVGAYILRLESAGYVGEGSVVVR